MYVGLLIRILVTHQEQAEKYSGTLWLLMEGKEVFHKRIQKQKGAFSLRTREEERMRSYLGGLNRFEPATLSTDLINQATIMRWSHEEMRQNLLDTKKDQEKLESDREELSQKLFSPVDFHQTRLRVADHTVHQRSMKFGMSSHKTRYDKMEPEKTRAMKKLQKMGDSFRLHKKKVKPLPAITMRGGQLIRAAEIEVTDMARLSLLELFRTLSRPKYKQVRENPHMVEFVSQMLRVEALRSHLYDLQYKLEKTSERDEVEEIFCTLMREYLSEYTVEYIDEPTVVVKRFNKRIREKFKEELDDMEEHIRKKRKTTQQSSPRRG